jgi:hypothetical protein
MGLSSVSLNRMLRLFCAASLLKTEYGVDTFLTLRSQPSAFRNHEPTILNVSGMDQSPAEGLPRVG